MKKLFFSFFLFLCVLSQVKAEKTSGLVSWPLSADKGETASISGQLQNAYLQLQGLVVNSYGGPNASIVITLEEGTSVPWNTTEEADKYIEFSVTPKEGSIFHAEEISFNICGKGGGNMRANIYYSKDKAFSQKNQVDYKVNSDLNRDLFEPESVTIDEIIEKGEKLYFRIYPYYKTNATGKYICLKDITIKGTTEATAVSASAKWGFTNNLTAEIKGGLIANDMTFGNGIEVYDYATSVPTLDGKPFIGGSVAPPKTTSCAWTASNEPIENIYIEYQVSPKSGATFTITDISVLVSAFATDKMQASVYYSKNADFLNKTELKNNINIAKDALDKWEYAMNEVINSGETFYLRIYPYLTINGTWKLLNIRDLIIVGTTVGATIDPPIVTTSTEVNDISTENVVVTGSVENDGGGEVSEYGIVWNNQPQPTLDNNKIIAGNGVGVFGATLTQLNPGTTYYARAYAINKAGISYGNEITFTTLTSLTPPNIELIGISNILNTSVTISGKVTDWGGTEVTERGVVWATNENPTINDNKLESGKGLGNFNILLDGLTPETKYNFRVYAVNSTGVAYSNNIDATTKATDPNITKVVAQNGTGDYTTLQEAFDQVPSNYTGKWIIRIKPGIYNERPTLAKGKINVYLIGEDASTTIITHNTYAGQEKPGGGTWGTSNSQTMSIEANDFTAANITIENTYVNSKANAAINANTQAVALKTQGDRQSFYNCRVTGYQDTYLGNSIGRAYFKDCYIEGNVDFIFGRQTVIFDHCTTYVNRNGSVLTAPSTEKTTKYGMVFLDCELTAPSTTYIDFDGNTFQSFYYGRPWQQQPKSAFIRCSTPSTLHEKGWTTMNGGLNPIFVEYACTGDGATSERLSQRGNDGKILTPSEAKAYTIRNIFSKETDPSFASDWMPQPIPDEILSIERIITDKKDTSSTAYPNPFENHFTISYNLIYESQVSINLYNMQGQLVSVILNKNQREGLHNISFNGSILGSGVYFYTIQSNNWKETNKIIKK